MLGALSMGTRNIHAWTHRTDEGAKREVRAEKFGAKWRIQAKVKGEESWTYYDVPDLEDLIELRRLLWNKYQRKHLAYEDVSAVEKLIRERGGSWEEEPSGGAPSHPKRKASVDEDANGGGDGDVDDGGE